MHFEFPSTFDGTTLPRSLRWKLQFGLLQMPLDDSINGIVPGIDSLVTENTSLVKEQRERYNQLVLKLDNDRFQKIGGDLKEEDEDPRGPDINLDPLSMLVRQDEEREAQEARERIYRKASNMVDIVRSHEIVAVVRKDLNRLHDEHASYYRSRANWKHHTQNQGEETDFEKAEQERNELLTQILHIYGKEHLRPGYQQGMHEICSYVMFVIEMDLFDIETSECQDYKDLLSADHLLHDTFALTEAILSQMEHAFGMGDEKHTKPVEQMGDSILHKIQYVARDKRLYTHLQSMENCLSLYTARWVRLLFAREAGGWRNVLQLWDILFDCITKNKHIISMDSSKYTRPGVTPSIQLGDFDLMAVLEMTAASLIWMHREHLMSHQVDEGLQILTGMDSLKEVAPLISTLLSSLRRLQISSNMPPLLHPGEKKAMMRRQKSRSFSPCPGRNRTNQSPQPSQSANRQPENRRDSFSRMASARQTVTPPSRVVRRRSIGDCAAQKDAQPHSPKGTMGQLVDMGKTYLFSSEPAPYAMPPPDAKGFSSYLDMGNLFSFPPEEEETNKPVGKPSFRRQSSVPLCIPPSRPGLSRRSNNQSMRIVTSWVNNSAEDVSAAVCSTYNAFVSRQGSSMSSESMHESMSSTISSSPIPTDANLSVQCSVSSPMEGDVTPVEDTASDVFHPTSEQHRRMSMFHENPNMMLLLSASTLDHSQESLFEQEDDVSESSQDLLEHDDEGAESFQEENYIATLNDSDDIHLNSIEPCAVEASKPALREPSKEDAVSESSQDLLQHEADESFQEENYITTLNDHDDSHNSIEPRTVEASKASLHELSKEDDIAESSQDLLQHEHEAAETFQGENYIATLNDNGDSHNSIEPRTVEASKASLHELSKEDAVAESSQDLLQHEHEAAESFQEENNIATLNDNGDREPSKEDNVAESSQDLLEHEDETSLFDSPEEPTSTCAIEKVDPEECPRENPVMKLFLRSMNGT
jgi:hypothetical protein